jgi:murein DD-endopeptidase MepM/ murein hydrolase activator NlpD
LIDFLGSGGQPLPGDAFCGALRAGTVLRTSDGLDLISRRRRLSNPKTQTGVFHRLSKPVAVMVATAGLMFLSLADRRSGEVVATVEAPALLVAVDAAAEELAATPRDRLVVAAIRPEQPLIKAVMRSRDELAAAAMPSQGSPASAPAAAVAPVVMANAVEAARASVSDHTGTEASAPAPEAQPAAADTPDVLPSVVQAAPPAPALSSPAVSQHRHPRPFDPLREPALTGAKDKQQSVAERLEALIAADEMHTVRVVREVAHEVKRGETLSTVLTRNGCGKRDVDKWIAAVRAQHDPNRIYAGQTIKLLLDMPEQTLRRITIEVGRSDTLTIEDNGIELVTHRKRAPLESTVRVVEGEIRTSLYDVAVSKGVPDRVISDAAEVLGWEINLGRDLQPGARFRLAYEQTMRLDTREATAGRLLAIELLNTGKRYEGFYYTTSDGKISGYYNRKGEGLGRAFLRYPVAFSRISSKFSTARFHPVLKKTKPHYGVDFAAPTGTPVKAVADGTITMAGWHGGNGRFVKIRHDKQYESGYAHLSRIASDMRPGARVKQGQVIGYVGATGLATGPHLHFAMYSHGKYVDPLQASLPRTMPLPPSAAASFKAQLSRVEAAYASNGMTAFGVDRPATASAAGPSTSKR